MRLGAPVYSVAATPESWVAAVQAKGYGAAYAPVGTDAGSATIAAYRRAAESAGIVIAEVGAWSNPLDSDPTKRQAAMEMCIASLRLADEIGARCCVNVAGSRSEKWAGPHPKNLSRETFDLIVNTVKEIIDSVRPKISVYALETMPWIYPDSLSSYAELIRAIDRDEFGVHFDPVNLVNSPERYFFNGTMIREFVAEFSPMIRSVHLKDVGLLDGFPVVLREVPLGEGGLAISVLLKELSHLEADLPVMLEHLPDEAAYDRAAAYTRQIAAQEGVLL
jgi:sugar phosphate isomerase/epimerase